MSAIHNNHSHVNNKSCPCVHNHWKKSVDKTLRMTKFVSSEHWPQSCWVWMIIKLVTITVFVKFDIRSRLNAKKSFITNPWNFYHSKSHMLQIWNEVWYLVPMTDAMTILINTRILLAGGNRVCEIPFWGGVSQVCSKVDLDAHLDLITWNFLLFLIFLIVTKPLHYLQPTKFSAAEFEDAHRVAQLWKPLRQLWSQVSIFSRLFLVSGIRYQVSIFSRLFLVSGI